MITGLDLFVAFETDVASSVAVSFVVFIFHISIVLLVCILCPCPDDSA